MRQDILTFESQDDVSLYIPEFDSEFITHKNYDGHPIPSIVWVNYAGKYNFPNESIKFKWPEVLENRYGVKNIETKASDILGNVMTIIDIELKAPRKNIASGEDY